MQPTAHRLPRDAGGRRDLAVVFVDAHARSAMEGIRLADVTESAGRHGMQLEEMLLEAWDPPNRERLVEELEARRARTRGRKRKQAA